MQSYETATWNALCRVGKPRSATLVKARTVLVVAGLFLGIACGGLSRGSGRLDQPTVVQVDNQGFLDMSIYVVRGVGERVRIGTATGNGKTNLRIPAGMVNGLTPLRFVADPIGGSRASVSQEITVAPGDTVGLMIPPV